MMTDMRNTIFGLTILLTGMLFNLMPAFAFESDEYVEPTVDNVAKLMFSTRMYMPSDMEDIDRYLLLTRCDVYRENRSNEFNWSQIRMIMSDFLEKNLHTFPKKMFFRVPLSVDEYDFARQEFPLMEISRLNEVRRIVFEIDHSDDECFDNNERFFFDAIETRFSVPLSLNGISANETQAQKIVRHFARTGNRFIYGKVYVTFQNPDTIRRVWSGTTAVFFAKIDKIEFYLNPTFTGLISETTF